MTPAKITFGTISHGTLRDEDLLEAFSYELEDLIQRSEWTGNRNNRDLLIKLVGEAREIDPDDNLASEIIAEMMDALNNEFAPSFTYFGAIEGDGSDFGFWPDINSLEMAVQDGEVLKVNDLSDVPDDYAGNVMLVNDHGNVTFGYVQTASTDFQMTWDCV